ncbi:MULTISPECIES: ExbD/TolR family protein [Thiomicrorhabdus]|uniref:Biopolymer transporter ExbD n=1 Tax=Thiomicrorhabdus heinhorstiae TaxID=2748010 RepID=A0ABS0BUY6_9GAMM|nr:MULTISPECIES: biopolymer transporter ExbD [Thiomicrorhabdus]MBF6057144.1 biopolymer transporter ExbD [Thiomicrorhabdus heinhorstiae]
MKRFDSINVIPLIDVMLVLLAIVLTTASFIVKDHLDITLPDTEHTQSYTPPEKDPLSISIDKNNRIFVAENAISFAELEQKLTQLDKSQALTLQVDREAKFGEFVKVVDLLKGQELNNLTILTESK